jgi:hypothetical protein
MEGPYFVANQRGLTGGIMETGFPYICFDVILPKQSIHYYVSIENDSSVSPFRKLRDLRLKSLSRRTSGTMA